MMVGRLYVLSGPHDGKRVYVLDRLNVYEIGVASGSHIKLHDKGVALNHCRLYRTGEEFTVYALSEKRATLINSAPIQKAQIQSGDRLRVGDTEMLFELVAPEDVNTPPAEPPPAAQAPQAPAGAPGNSARLLVLDGDNRGQIFSLAGREAFKIGRASTSDFRINDAKMSRDHCRIENAQNHFMIIDLESANGTIVNGEKVRKALLKNGDFLRLGFTMLRFESA